MAVFTDTPTGRAEKQIRKDVGARAEEARQVFLARYRRRRLDGYRPEAALQVIRGQAACAWAGMVCSGFHGDPLELAVAMTADAAIHSRVPMPGYWWH